MEIKTFDKHVLKFISEDINNALKEVNKKYSIDIKTGSGSFTPENFTIKIVGALIKDGQTVSKEKIAFEKYADLFGLAKTDLNKEFYCQGKKYKIIGLKMSSQKYPVLALELGKNKRFKFSANAIKNCLVYNT